MDELKLKLGSKFMKGFIAKMISKYLSKQLGAKVDFKFKDLDISIEDGDTVVKTSLEVKVNKDDFYTILDKFDI